MNPHEEKERALWRQQKHLEIKEELRQNEVFISYLKQGNPDKHEEFIDEYAQQKLMWLEFGPNHVRYLEQDGLKWVNDTTQRLGEILQKKLFDVQCQWRAEQLDIQQVDICDDFHTWERNIFNCPFVEPVTEEDVELYRQYLNSSNFEHQQGWFESWQDYRGIKEAYQSENANRSFPDWYDFHNGRTGMSAMLLLPDIRGEKEEFYMDLWRKDYHQKRKAEQKAREEGKLPQPEGYDPRPFLNHHEQGWMTWFVDTYEDKETQDMFRKYGGERSFEDIDDDFWIGEDLDLLEKADRIVPIQGWYDWREAVHRAAEQYRREKIAEALPLAYEQYRMNIDLGLGFSEPENQETQFSTNKWFRNAILDGREMNGELRNFDF